MNFRNPIQTTLYTLRAPYLQRQFSDLAVDFSSLKNPMNVFFYAFVFLHVICWTLAPTLGRFNLPMDSIEGTVWAQKLVFGYDKAPLLNAWITALAVWLFGHADWAIYLTSQLSVAICFIALWRLAGKILPPAYALLSVVILEGFQYYNIGAIDFVDNVLQLPLWALTCLFFYKALNEKKYIDWFWLGLFAGLAMLAKYYAVLLLFSMFLFLCRRENRHWVRKKDPYLAAIVFFAVISPHIVWLFQNDFLTIHYVFKRVGDLPTWTSHFINPLLFLRDEAYALLFAGLLFVFLFVGKSRQHTSVFPKLLENNLSFLIYLAIGPILLALLLSVLTGIKLHIMWGSALFSLWGILFIGFFQPVLTTKKIYQFFTMLFLLSILALTGYLLSMHWAKNKSSAHFPGQTIANTLIANWEQRYHRPLAYVIGNRWLAGNVSFYSDQHPIVFIDADIRLAPWLNLADVDKKGALFIWDADKYGNSIPSNYKFFTSTRNYVTEIKTFTWQKAQKEQPVKIGVLFLPPHLEKS